MANYSSGNIERPRVLKTLGNFRVSRAKPGEIRATGYHRLGEPLDHGGQDRASNFRVSLPETGRGEIAERVGVPRTTVQEILTEIRKYGIPSIPGLFAPDPADYAGRGSAPRCVTPRL